eukprot:GHVT01001762.1.p1 GENE.GHVT01001762.1~~GHVT01001762.1.p1  ORF type:complete len:667 (-),score=68.83 GHVT01001762.1:353-2353(-)
MMLHSGSPHPVGSWTRSCAGDTVIFERMRAKVDVSFWKALASKKVEEWQSEAPWVWMVGSVSAAHGGCPTLQIDERSSGLFRTNSASPGGSTWALDVWSGCKAASIICPGLFVNFNTLKDFELHVKQASVSCVIRSRPLAPGTVVNNLLQDINSAMEISDNSGGNISVIDMFSLDKDIGTEYWSGSNLRHSWILGNHVDKDIGQEDACKIPWCQKISPYSLVSRFVFLCHLDMVTYEASYAIAIPSFHPAVPFTHAQPPLCVSNAGLAAPISATTDLLPDCNAPICCTGLSTTMIEKLATAIGTIDRDSKHLSFVRTGLFLLHFPSKEDTGDFVSKVDSVDSSLSLSLWPEPPLTLCAGDTSFHVRPVTHLEHLRNSLAQVGAIPSSVADQNPRRTCEFLRFGWCHGSVIIAFFDPSCTPERPCCLAANILAVLAEKFDLCGLALPVLAVRDRIDSRQFQVPRTTSKPVAQSSQSVLFHVIFPPGAADQLTSSESNSSLAFSACTFPAAHSTSSSSSSSKPPSDGTISAFQTSTTSSTISSQPLLSFSMPSNSSTASACDSSCPLVPVCSFRRLLGTVYGGWLLPSQQQRDGRGAGAAGVFVVRLRDFLDPNTLQRAAVNLHVKLIKWRILPEFKPEKFQDLKVLILGAGALGCAMARLLVAWGTQ